MAGSTTLLMFMVLTQQCRSNKLLKAFAFCRKSVSIPYQVLTMMITVTIMVMNTLMPLPKCSFGGDVQHRVCRNCPPSCTLKITHYLEHIVSESSNLIGRFEALLSGADPEILKGGEGAHKFGEILGSM